MTLLAASPDGPTPPVAPTVAEPSAPAPAKPSAAALAAAAATAKAEPKPEPKPEAKSDAKPSAGQDAKAEAKTEASKDEKSEAKKDGKSAAARSVTAEAALKAAAAGTSEADASDSPPSLSKQALCAEVSKSVRDQQAARTKLAEERKALAAERARLEALSADISKSREALRKETQRLEDLMAHRVPGNAGGDSFSFSPSGKPSGDIESLAKTFKTMAPDQVANLLTRMDRVLSAQVLHHMRPADAGAVIEKLKPDLAADLVAQMATVPAEKTVKR
jgi:flagellar motility protein MotE (MotC chaperone)